MLKERMLDSMKEERKKQAFNSLEMVSLVLTFLSEKVLYPKCFVNNNRY